MSNVLVVAEHVGGALRNVTLSAINFGKQAAAITGGKVHVLVLGDGVDAVAKQLADGGYGADTVHLGNGGQFANYLAENYAPAVAEVAKAIGAEVVCAPSSTTGKDLLPRVAAHLEAGMVSDAIEEELHKLLDEHQDVSHSMTDVVSNCEFMVKEHKKE